MIKSFFDKRVLFFFSFLFFSFVPSYSFARERIEGVVAIVNTEIITDSDVRAFNKKLQSNGIIDDLLLAGENAETIKGSPDKQLQYLINEKLLESEIKRLNLAVTVERVEQELRDIAKKNGISRADLNQAIKAQGMNFSDYQDFVKSRIERQSLIEQEITSKIRVADEDVLAEYLKRNQGATSGIYEYTLSHIFFNPKKSGGWSAAEERAKMAHQRLVQGESFDTVAEQYSEDSRFSPGGTLGVFKAGEFAQEMELAVSRLAVGDFSAPVRLKGGVHILKILNKKVVSDPHFEKEKDKIRSELYEKSFQKQLKNWIEQKKEDAFIRINKK